MTFEDLITSLRDAGSTGLIVTPKAAGPQVTLLPRWLVDYLNMVKNSE